MGRISSQQRHDVDVRLGVWMELNTVHGDRCQKVAIPSVDSALSGEEMYCVVCHTCTGESSITMSLLYTWFNEAQH